MFSGAPTAMRVTLPTLVTNATTGAAAAAPSAVTAVAIRCWGHAVWVDKLVCGRAVSPQDFRVVSIRPWHGECS